MSDTETTNITAAGSGKSEAEVAFDLLNKLKGQGVWGERNLTAILNMYAECLDAAKGLRPYPGQNRVDAPIASPGTGMEAAASKTVAAQPQIQAQLQAQAQVQPQAQLQAQPQAQAHAQAPAQSVQVQQQMLQQAFKQG